jgi:hypothetical protein
MQFIIHHYFFSVSFRHRLFVDGNNCKIKGHTLCKLEWTNMKAAFEAVKLDNNEQLEQLRNKMIQAANTLGIQHPMVLKYSQKIDETHNKIMKMQMANK